MAVGDLQRIVGRNLRAYRQAKGLSQEAFAEQIGVHRTYMGGLERGERNLTLKSVERIAEVMGVEVWELMAEVMTAAGADLITMTPPNAAPA